MAEKHEAEIFLKQNIATALKTAGKAVIDTRAGLATVGPAAKASFSMAGGAVTALNQSLEIGKKAIETFRATIGASIETSLQFRRQGDETVAYFKSLQRESDLVKARLGDALLPVIRGFTEATGAATGSISDWIAENQKLIGQGLVDFLGNTAMMLTTGVATGVNLVAKAWYGWQLVIDGVAMAINKMFSGALAVIDDFLSTTGEIASQFGADGVAGSINKARESIQGLGAEFDRSSDLAASGIEETAAKLAETEGAIKRVEGIVRSVIKDGMVKGQEEVARATTGLTKNIEEQTTALERQGSIVDDIMKKRIAAIEKETAMREKDARAFDAKQQAGAGAGAEDAGFGAQAAGAALSGAGGAVGSVGSGLATGGLAGGAAAAIGEMVAQSDALQKAFGKVNEVFAALIGAMEPLFIAMEPIIDILLTVFQPVIEVLGKVLRSVASFLLSIVKSIAKVWNAIIGAIAGIFKKLGSVKVFGQKPLGFLEEWGKDFQKKASVNTSKIDKAQKAISEGYEDTAETLSDGADAVKESTKEIGNSMNNVPTGIKLALAEYRAATGVSRSGIPSVDPVSRGVFSRENADTRREYTFLGNVIVNGVTDVESLRQGIAKETESQSVREFGTLSRAARGGALP